MTWIWKRGVKGRKGEGGRGKREGERGKGNKKGNKRGQRREGKGREEGITHSSLPVSSGATETLTPAINPFFSSRSICCDAGVGISSLSTPVQSFMAVNGVPGSVAMVSTEDSAAT
jgi:hypothetical protein